MALLEVKIVLDDVRHGMHTVAIVPRNAHELLVLVYP
eukprot:CAMPEP_0206046106 /NCGR_PEP_ID=MMETSP1466-20131121/17700_1 /ASSEMBLY_ACC=CAM_ASM_001126 /TAXON_ID=44452 /ORGANISM="Pavlova gyrans, Strain CCMP608" /LENGTH=36 /DNA_ID= /DNA_START= /DNA_END= /DNA_ORIENTATION=